MWVVVSDVLERRFWKLSSGEHSFTKMYMVFIPLEKKSLGRSVYVKVRLHRYISSEVVSFHCTDGKLYY